MTRGERAKIFAPFDAMKGLQEALRDREERHMRVPKREISEEDAEQNSRTLTKVERGMKIEIFCYSGFHDVFKRGTVTDIDKIFRHLKLDGQRIWFDDIYKLRITDYLNEGVRR